MEPWQATGGTPSAIGQETKDVAWWKFMAWTSLFVRYALPSLLLWAWAWRGDASAAWWAALALAALADAWGAYGLLLQFQRGLKERLYAWPPRVAADLGMLAAWALVSGGAWLAAARGPAWARPPAASLGFLATGLAGAFGAYALRSVLLGPRTLRLAEQDPVDAAAFAPPPGLRGRLRVAHLSDLHLTVDESVPAEYGGPGGNAPWRVLLARHGAALGRQQALLLSGDLVDSGRAGEWRVFFEAWDGRGLSGRCVLVPGNHEVNIIDPGDWAALDPAHALRAKRLVRTLAAMDRLQGDRAWVLGPQGPLRLRRHLAGHAALLRSFIDDPGLLRRGAPWLRRLAYLLTGRGLPASADARERLRRLEAVWQASFPQLVELPGTDALVMVLNSNVDASSLWDNALGELDAAQLSRCRELGGLARFSRRPQWTLLHHHVALPPLDWDLGRNFKADLMSLLNPRDLVQGLPPGRQLILHGHKHLSYFGLLEGRFQVVAAPSCTLRDERDPRRPLGFYAYTVALGGGQAALAGKPRFHSYA